MEMIPYASIVESLIYAMECTWPNIAHVIGVISWLSSNLAMEH